ncbi:MAG: UDP-N-acetylenolpyruvoylglucosamine reductase [Thalassobius sp.]|nr:UDP-N-acetylenolpyruvoylglucosamine reductase [Thalassovita sp.]
MEILENFVLKSYNAFGIPAKARFFTHLYTTEELQELINTPIFKENKRLILGGGSNLLFTQDFDGLVVKTAQKGIELVDEDAEHFYVKVQAGENWHQFVLRTVEEGWQGLENLSLIPGTVGAAPIQNIGAYGVEVEQFIYEVSAIDLQSGEIRKFTAQECKFAYRNSVFKQELKGKYLISEVTFRLNKSPKFNLTYAALSQYLEAQNLGSPSQKAISEAVINIRSSKLPNPEEIGNCGSFFKNPVVEEAVFKRVLSENANMPYYSAGEGFYKIPAGWLIEQCGFKGKVFGNVGTYSKQALVLINCGNATGEEAWNFANKIIDTVSGKFGISLEPEVNII